MKISHEVPLILLEESFKFNDFCYCLPLFWGNEKYREHFIESRRRGRFIILDNGLFEGKVEDKTKLLEIYETIKPDVFISPDAWNDATTTWNNFQECKQIIPLDKIMVVIQGKNYYEAANLHWRLADEGVKYIGFNHSGEFYDTLSSHSEDAMRKTLGRIEFTHKLGLREGIHYHLLGTNLAEEFKYHLDLPQIKSGDTSNPITLAFDGKLYDGRIKTKPKTKMETIFDWKFDAWEEGLFSFRALKNIHYFRDNFTT